MLRVVLVVDCERFISFKQKNPRWNGFEKLKGKINNLIKNFRYNRFGFEVVYKTLVREEFPTTLMIVGRLFKPIKGAEFIECGYHSLNHLPLTLLDDEKLKKQIENKFKLRSFNAPMWMIEDVKNPKRIFKLLKKEKYSHCVYRGENNAIKHFHKNSVGKPLKKEGITCVNVSNWFEGNSNKREIEKIKKEILNNLESDKVYLLSSHDFTHKNNKNLLEVIHFLKKLEKEGKIKIMRLKEVK
ncbi:MAG: aldo/keto reductase [Candidatus Pacearchaeota archaeon]|jgi:hypothetical protein